MCRRLGLVGRALSAKYTAFMLNIVPLSPLLAPTEWSGRLLSIAAHRNAEEAYLPFELFACLAPEQVRPDAQALMERHLAVLNLRDQAARVLA
jgi:hypothetical protein